MVGRWFIVFIPPEKSLRKVRKKQLTCWAPPNPRPRLPSPKRRCFENRGVDDPFGSVWWWTSKEPTSGIWMLPKNSGFSSKSSILNRVFHDFHHPFWGKHPYFLVQHPNIDHQIPIRKLPVIHGWGFWGPLEGLGLKKAEVLRDFFWGTKIPQQKVFIKMICWGV